MFSLKGFSLGALVIRQIVYLQIHKDHQSIDKENMYIRPDFMGLGIGKLEFLEFDSEVVDSVLSCSYLREDELSGLRIGYFY
jgi:hypothetical protein